MSDPPDGRRPLSDAERAALRPEIDADALEEFLGHVPAELHAELLAFCGPAVAAAQPPPPVIRREGDEYVLPDGFRRPAGRRIRAEFQPGPWTDWQFLVLNDPALRALWQRVLGQSGSA